MHIWGRAHRVRRRGGLGVTSREEAGQQPARGLRGKPVELHAGAERRDCRCAGAGVNAVSDGCIMKRNESRSVGRGGCWLSFGVAGSHGRRVSGCAHVDSNPVSQNSISSQDLVIRCVTCFRRDWSRCTVSQFAWVQLCRRYYYRPGELRDGFLGQGGLGSHVGSLAGKGDEP